MVAALATLYVLQALSPIRLDNDSVVVLRAGARLADGLPADFPNSPLGYSIFIAALDRLGLGGYPVFVLANCLFVGVAIVCIVKLDSKRGGSKRQRWFVPLSLLAFPVIRYMPIATPDTLFLSVAMAAVLAMNEACRSKTIGRRVQLVILALILTAIGITLRIMGVVLIPALLAACFLSMDGRLSLHRSAIRSSVTVALAALAVVMFVAFRLADSFQRYSSEAFLGYIHESAWRAMGNRATENLETIGGLVLNLPQARFGAFLWWFLAAGAAGVAVVLGVVRVERPRTPAGVYLATSIVLLILWPYNTPRLWLPIVPLLIAYLESAPLRFTPGPVSRWMMRGYLACFVAAGLVSLAYTTRITFSGKDFPKVYGLAGGMSAPDPRTGRVDELHNERARALMRRYGHTF